jgi:hypothetical protein
MPTQLSGDASSRDVYQPPLRARPDAPEERVYVEVGPSARRELLDRLAAILTTKELAAMQPRTFGGSALLRARTLNHLAGDPLIRDALTLDLCTGDADLLATTLATATGETIVHLDHLDVRLTDSGDVSLVPRNLPSIADPSAFAIELTESALVELLAMSRTRQLGLDSDRTGAL